MNITTEKALDYHQAFVRLDGYARAVVTQQGPQIVVDSYDLSPKVKWRCIINREILQKVKDGFEKKRTANQKAYNDLKAGLDPKMDEKDREATLDAFQHKLNVELAELGQQDNEIVGLMKLPGDGIRIRARDPNIMGILALIRSDFIEGEADYGQKKEPGEVKDA